MNYADQNIARALFSSLTVLIFYSSQVIHNQCVMLEYKKTFGTASLWLLMLNKWNRARKMAI